MKKMERMEVGEGNGGVRVFDKNSKKGGAPPRNVNGGGGVEAKPKLCPGRSQDSLKSQDSGVNVISGEFDSDSDTDLDQILNVMDLSEPIHEERKTLRNRNTNSNTMGSYPDVTIVTRLRIHGGTVDASWPRRTKSGLTYLVKVVKGDTEEPRDAFLSLSDLWLRVKWLKPDTIVNVVGISMNADRSFTLNKMNGYLIVEPDRLIGITSIISNLYCERKAAFWRFNPGGDNAAMFQGVVAHEVISSAMWKGLDKLKDIQEEAERICSLPVTLDRAYGIGLTDEELITIRRDVVEWVMHYMTVYYKPSSGKMSTDLKGSKALSSIQVLAIEDTIWCPLFGLKGKVDATVSIKTDDGNKIAPLEFKTGNKNPTARFEKKADHIGQLQLYTLLMQNKYGSISDFILYYIKDKIMLFEGPRRTELAQLILNRNLVFQNSTLCDGEMENLPMAEADFNRQCTRCEMQSVCSAEISLKLAKNTISKGVMNRTEIKLEESNVLNEGELKFFEGWIRMINAETQGIESKFTDKNLWRKTETERERGGTCISNLILDLHHPDVSKQKLTQSMSYLISLTVKPDAPQKPDEYNLTNLFQRDDFVVIGTKSEPCISYANITNLSDNHVTLMLQHAWHKEYESGEFTFTVDKVQSCSPIGSQYGYLLKLMYNTPQAARLRDYIIHKKKPQFSKQTLPDAPSQRILCGLNDEQQKVVMEAMCTDSFLLVQGCPGSGKTSTIVALMRMLVHAKKSILVVSYTSTALDNILLKYRQYDENFIRINSVLSKLPADLRGYSSETIVGKCKTISELTEQYSVPVVGTTLLSLKHSIFRARLFDYCIIDEASQALPTSVFGCLHLSNKYIVFGDEHQLPPVVSSSYAKSLDLCDNFFSLMGPSHVSMNSQYRMSIGIMKLANALIYENKMKAPETVLNRYLKIDRSLIVSYLRNEVMCPETRTALCYVISKQRHKSVVFLDTSLTNSFHMQFNGSLINANEQSLAGACVRIFVECGINPKEIGVISPYRAQADEIKKLLGKFPKKYHDIQVNTVDQFQGQEKEVIICSFTKSAKPVEAGAGKQKLFAVEVDKSDKVHGGILEDKRRLNVTITRARTKLVMIGNGITLANFTPFAKLFEVLLANQVVRLEPSVINDMGRVVACELVKGEISRELDKNSRNRTSCPCPSDDKILCECMPHGEPNGENGETQIVVDNLEPEESSQSRREKNKKKGGLDVLKPRHPN